MIYHTLCKHKVSKCDYFKYYQYIILSLLQGYEYSRSANPTRDCLEKSLAAAEGGKHCEFRSVCHLMIPKNIKQSSTSFVRDSKWGCRLEMTLLSMGR